MEAQASAAAVYFCPPPARSLLPQEVAFLSPCCLSSCQHSPRDTARPELFLNAVATDLPLGRSPWGILARGGCSSPRQLFGSQSIQKTTVHFTSTNIPNIGEEGRNQEPNDKWSAGLGGEKGSFLREVLINDGIHPGSGNLATEKAMAEAAHGWCPLRAAEYSKASVGTVSKYLKMGTEDGWLLPPCLVWDRKVVAQAPSLGKGSPQPTPSRR